MSHPAPELLVRPPDRPRGGRPTKAAAAQRDQRLLDIATQLFLEHGFEGTTIDGVAEAAAVGKATLYARYPDKAALFADVLRRRIIEVYAPLEAEFGAFDGDLEGTLCCVAERLIALMLSDNAVALGRILTAQAPRFPDLARLAMSEGYGRQLRLVESVLARFSATLDLLADDLPQAADLFLSLVLGRAARMKAYGLRFDTTEVEARTRAAVRLFVRGVGG